MNCVTVETLLMENLIIAGRFYLTHLAPFSTLQRKIEEADRRGWMEVIEGINLENRMKSPIFFKCGSFCQLSAEF